MHLLNILHYFFIMLFLDLCSMSRCNRRQSCFHLQSKGKYNFVSNYIPVNTNKN